MDLKAELRSHFRAIRTMDYPDKLRKIVRSRQNRRQFGADAPFPDQRIYVNPQVITTYVRRDLLPKQLYKKSGSGTVISGDWDQRRNPLSEHKKFIACRRHFTDGVRWEDTGIIEEKFRYYAERNIKLTPFLRRKVLARYESMDAIFERLKTDGFVSDKDQLEGLGPYETEGIGVHIDREGKPFFAGNGCHRLAMAQILGFSEVPAMVGLVHEDAVRNGLFASLTKPSS